jgi:hypothetical protein
MQKHNIYVGFEVLTPVVMKSSIFWDITPCSSACYLLHAGILIDLFNPEDEGDMFLRNVG